MLEFGIGFAQGELLPGDGIGESVAGGECGDLGLAFIGQRFESGVRAGFAGVVHKAVGRGFWFPIFVLTMYWSTKLVTSVTTAR
jgi:hypothetical protein